MPDTDTEARRWTIRHFQPAETYSADDGLVEAHALLRAQIDAEGFVIDTDTLTAGDPSPITVYSDGSGYEPYQGEVNQRGPFTRGQGGPDGFITEYSAAATERIVDDIRTVPVPDQDRDDVVWADVPEENTAVGGGLRVEHKLGGPVVVTAYDREGEPTGYLFAQDVSDDEVHVELVAGAARLRIEREAVETDA